MGNVADFLYIDEDTGDIYVSANDSFDYHRQNLIFVQVIQEIDKDYEGCWSNHVNSTIFYVIFRCELTILLESLIIQLFRNW